MLNMTYDVPVKLLSFHLALFALFLLAPDLRRLANFLLLQQDVAPLSPRQLFTGVRANRIALAAQLVFGLWLVGMNLYGARKGWHEYGPGRERSALYGIWDIEQLSMNGQVRAPLLTDSERYHRAIFDFPQGAAFEQMDGTMIYSGAAVDTQKQSITLTARTKDKSKSSFNYQRLGRDQLVLDGVVNSRPSNNRNGTSTRQ